jgi:DNA-binding transcriptional LysR family regulator
VAFEHLILFRDVVQEKSISRGAALNRVSQSAASQHIRELEERMGATLLDRSTRPFTLTPAGKLYYQMCRDVLLRNEEFQVALEGLKTEVEGTVRVASIYSVGISEMSHLKEEFSRQFPQASLEVEYLRPDKVYEAVLADRADLGFVSYPQASRLLAVIPFREERMAVCAAPSHPLGRRPVVRLAELQGCDFVAFDEDLPIRQEIDHFLREQGVVVRVAMHFDNIQMIKEAVALGSGISILPVRPLRAEVEQGRLVAIPLEAELIRPIGIVHRRRKKLHRAAQCFLELLARQLEPVAPVDCG